MKGSWLACIVMSFACISCTPRLPLQASNGEDSEAAQSEPKLSLSIFQCIRGTSFLRASLSTSNSWRSFSSSYEEGQTRNYIFLDGDEISFRKLLETDERVILRSVDLPEKSFPGSSGETAQTTCKNDPNPVKYLVYFTVNRDTNGDKKLSWEDTQELAIADPSGRNYVGVIQDIQNFYGYVYRPESEDLIFIYRREGTRYVSTIDLAERTVTATETIDILGPNVQ